MKLNVTLKENAGTISGEFIRKYSYSLDMRMTEKSEAEKILSNNLPVGLAVENDGESEYFRVDIPNEMIERVKFCSDEKASQKN